MRPKIACGTEEAVVSFLRGALLLCGLLSLLVGAAPAKAAAPADDVVFGPGLICDTQDQAERVVALLGDGVESAPVSSTAKPAPRMLAS